MDRRLSVDCLISRFYCYLNLMEVYKLIYFRQFGHLNFLNSILISIFVCLYRNQRTCYYHYLVGLLDSLALEEAYNLYCYCCSDSFEALEEVSYYCYYWHFYFSLFALALHCWCLEYYWCRHFFYEQLF